MKSACIDIGERLAKLLAVPLQYLGTAPPLIRSLGDGKMTDLVKHFIIDHTKYIEAGDWSALYEKAYKSINVYQIGEMTEVFLSADVDPLEFLDYIPGGMFAGSKIESIDIPPHITKICVGAFIDCNNLKTVSIPASIQKVEPNAFARCTALSEVIFQGTSDQWSKIAPSQLHVFRRCSPLTLRCSDDTFNIGST